MGLALAQARIGWPSGLGTFPKVDREFIVLASSREVAQRRELAREHSSAGLVAVNDRRHWLRMSD